MIVLEVLALIAYIAGVAVFYHFAMTRSMWWFPVFLTFTMVPIILAATLTDR